MGRKIFPPLFKNHFTNILKIKTMLYKTVIFLYSMYVLVGFATTTGTTKRLQPSLYTISGTTFSAIEDKLSARAKVGVTSHAANDTLIGQFSVPAYGTTTYNFRTYITSPRCDSLKVYIGSTKVYQYNYTTTGFVSHSFTFTANPMTPQTIKFVTVYGDTLAGSWFLENQSVRQ